MSVECGMRREELVKTMQREHEKNNPYHKRRVCLEVHSSDDGRSRIDGEPMQRSADERQVCGGREVMK